nr:hypothetical protein KUHPSE08_03100 [Staphylococcus epidermidis]
MNEQWMSALPLDNVKDISPVSGGDVNEAFKVTTVEEDIFFYSFNVNDQKPFMPQKLQD